MSYFSQKEFQAFLAIEAGHISSGWLALSGKVLSATEARELEKLLDEFFRRTGHISFKKHGKEGGQR